MNAACIPKYKKKHKTPKYYRELLDHTLCYVHSASDQNTINRMCGLSSQIILLSDARNGFTV